MKFYLNFVINIHMTPNKYLMNRYSEIQFSSQSILDNVNLRVFGEIIVSRQVMMNKFSG